MAKTFLSNIDLNKNELQNVKAHTLASAPGTPAEAQFYYNSTSKTLSYYTGSTWIVLGRLDQISAPTGDVAFGGFKLTNVGTPTVGTDAATKAYVDSVAQGIDAKASCRVATTAAGTLATSFAAGQTVDGVVLALNDRILIKNQAAPAENGIRIVTAGTPTRATDMDAWSEVPGAFTFIEEGTTNADTGWICSSNAGGTLDTTAIDWVQFSQAGVITAGTGLTKTGNVIGMADMAATSVKGRSAGTSGAPADIAASADNQVLRRSGGTLAFGTIDTAAIGSGTLAAARMPALTGDVTTSAGAVATTIANDAVSNVKLANMATSTIKGRVTAGTGDPEDLSAAQVRTVLGLSGQFSADVGNGTLTDIVINHNLGSRDVVVEVYRNSSPWDTVMCDVERTDANNVTLRFAVAPTAAQYRAVVK